MGWFDFLKDFFKGIIPEKLINFDVKIDNRKIDNRKVIITSDKIILGDQTINDPEIINKVFDKISEYKKEESLPFQLLHQDLVKDYLGYEEISIKEKNSLKLLKEVLPPEEIECIFMARRLVLAINTDDEELKKSLYNQLDKHYPKKGKKILNLMTSGYFDELILPSIEDFKREHGEKEYIQKFRNFYDDLLKFFPLGIFVGPIMTEKFIEEELVRRLKLKIPFIRLHAIGEANIEKVENVTKKLNIEQSYNVKDNRKTNPQGLKTQVYEISLGS